MTTKADVLSIEMYSTFGRANFRMTGFDGDAPKLVVLPTTKPDPNDKPKPYDPPLVPAAKGSAPGFGSPF